MTANVEPGPTEPAVDVPAELVAALQASPAAGAAFQRLAPSHRREYATWVGSAAQAPTRARRAARAVEMLLAGGRR